MDHIDSLIDGLPLESKAEFDHAMSALIRNADDNHIDILGGMRINTANADHDYGIEIYHVTRAGD